MPTCLNKDCGVFVGTNEAVCEFCGLPLPERKPNPETELEKNPQKESSEPFYKTLFAAWFALLAFAGFHFESFLFGTVLLPFDAFFAMLAASMCSYSLLPPSKKLLLASTKTRKSDIQQLILPVQNSISAQKKLAERHLDETHKQLDSLIWIIDREQKDQTLIRDHEQIAFRTDRLLPVLCKKMRVLVSKLLTIDLLYWVNQCESICDDLDSRDQMGFNKCYKELEEKKKELRKLEQTWACFLKGHVSWVEVRPIPNVRETDGKNRFLDVYTQKLSGDDALKIAKAADTLSELMFSLHRIQERKAVQGIRPLEQFEESRPIGESASAVRTLLLQIEEPFRLADLESEYQRVVAEERVIQSMSPQVRRDLYE